MSRGIDSKLVILKTAGKYGKILKNRSIERAYLESTPVLINPDEVTMDETIYEKKVVWRAQTKLWSLSERFYGDGRYYWVIGLYNNKPTDAHWTPGDIVYVPMPFEYVVSLIEY